MKDFCQGLLQEDGSICDSSRWEGESPAEPDSLAKADKRLRFGGSLTLP